MHRDHFAQLALDRSHVDDDLAVIDPVEGLDGQQRNGIHGGGQHDEVRFGEPLLEPDNPVGQSQTERFGGVFLGTLDPEDLFGQFMVTQGQGERASDQAQSDDHCFHLLSNLWLVLVSAAFAPPHTRQTGSRAFQRPGPSFGAHRRPAREVPGPSAGWPQIGRIPIFIIKKRGHRRVAPRKSRPLS